LVSESRRFFFTASMEFTIANRLMEPMDSIPQWFIFAGGGQASFCKFSKRFQPKKTPETHICWHKPSYGAGERSNHPAWKGHLPFAARSVPQTLQECWYLFANISKSLVWVNLRRNPKQGSNFLQCTCKAQWNMKKNIKRKRCFKFFLK